MSVDPDSKIDLHGHTVQEAVDAFTRFYNDKLKNGVTGGIRVIHGYGSTGVGGDIKARIRGYLFEHREYLSFEQGEDSPEKNAGETTVYPRKMLPSSDDRLSGQILSYCRQPKTKSQIVGKFVKQGAPKIATAIESLIKQKLLLMDRNKKGEKTYAGR